MQYHQDEVFPVTNTLDIFARGDAGPPPSVSWTTKFNGHLIVSGLCMGWSASLPNTSYWNTVIGPDCEAFSEIDTRPGDGDGCGLFIRFDFATDSGYVVGFVRDDSGGDTWAIYRYDSNIPTLLDAGSLIWQDGESIGVRCTGLTLSLYHKPIGEAWKLIATVADTIYAAAGYIGLTGQKNISRFASFGGGTIVADASTGDVYQAKVWLQDDNFNGYDRYVVCWFENGEPILTGVTDAFITVFKESDGGELFSGILEEIGSLGIYHRNEANYRVVDGEAYIAVVEATIDGATRVWCQPVGRDS